MDFKKSFNIAFNELQKAINENRLNYFKKELLKVLEAKENHNNNVVSKAIEDYDNSMSKTLREVFGIEKGRLANIGEVREWKGKKYRKIAPGKWRPIYESETRGAKQSIRILKSKI